MARKPDPEARERMLRTATRLFAQHGVHAVGLQQIIDDCHCGKNLLYREFGSKDELVMAFLERCARSWQEALDRAARAADGDPAGQLLALVDALAEEAADPAFRGCALRNAFAEFPDEDHPAHQFIVEHYAARQADLRAIARRADVTDPDELADRVELILDGLNTNGAVLGTRGAAGVARAFAEDVIRAARVPAGSGRQDSFPRLPQRPRSASGRPPGS
ncbi:TetR/AcrR family transcriptional regulator [Streptomyces litchfieldiae]|uniref:TetR/AcrR family transcriptional regulator n=1 Tax=Streptomyces litchfieldiae TaxID=3075543 RepID=A0ABU2MTV0_9ACTN|nr:TetR/AcrR family transcriptional regulator [Streptomyces sp. DSM 44938]MDT0344504.1 TetR/AcrR family transcriptional regulator [Streptomyces sp. DSM 44938]